MANRVKTVEQARALPEIEDEFYVITKRVEGGVAVNYYEPRRLCGVGVNGEEILLFVDTDGRSMKVVQTDKGPAKCELRL